MSRLLKFLAIAACTHALAGCSSDGGSDSDNTNDNGADDATSLESVNDCTPGSAVDLSGQPAVTITDQAPWSIGHGVCILVDAGSRVTWEGNFNFHPLVGGSPGTTDATSPITLASPQSGTDPVTVQFDTDGTYGYFCTIHGAAMQGVVYVD